MNKNIYKYCALTPMVVTPMVVKYFSLGTEITYFHLIDMNMGFLYNSCRINLRIKPVLPFYHDKIEFYFLTRGGLVIGDSRRGFILGSNIFGGFGFNFYVRKNFWSGTLFDTGAEFLSYKYYVDCEKMCGDCSILGWHQFRAFLTLNYRF